MRLAYYIKVLYELTINCKLVSLINHVYEEKNGVFKLRFTDVHDLLAIKEVIFDNDYLKKYTPIKVPKVVVDIGAGVGDFCLKVHLDYPKAKIWAFEPNKIAFSALEKNLIINKVNCQAINFGVSKLSEVFSYVDSVDILKIDCEGAEFKILKNQTNFLKKVKFITGEYHDKYGKVSDLMEWLEIAGFEVSLERQRGVQDLGLFTARRA